MKRLFLVLFIFFLINPFYLECGQGFSTARTQDNDALPCNIAEIFGDVDFINFDEVREDGATLVTGEDDQVCPRLFINIPETFGDHEYSLATTSYEIIEQNAQEIKDLMQMLRDDFSLDTALSLISLMFVLQELLKKRPCVEFRGLYGEFRVIYDEVKYLIRHHNRRFAL
jgi:hypothetical protein